MKSQVLDSTESDQHGHQLGNIPGHMVVGTQARQSYRPTDQDVSTSYKASENGINTVVEFQARVMDAVIADPAAWLRRERRYLEIDSDKRRSRGQHVASDASFGILLSGQSTVSRLSSEGPRREDSNENPVSPAYANSESETCLLPGSRRTAERDTDFRALGDAALCFKMPHQEGELSSYLPRYKDVTSDCQELAN
ncbi:hypothetical protein FMUND_15657 [Fusarium mundagurra]|uniref:Uncharacterized protein n=1 Tax=Fusarium mundagurra TaxID=1567541 RepID=A0A8H6CYE8_9HYPO|nr:hypothetical protein FMUND_15657 [Fusarium mundagurra]